MKKRLVEVYDVTRFVRDLIGESDERNPFEDVWQGRPFHMGKVK